MWTSSDEEEILSLLALEADENIRAAFDVVSLIRLFKPLAVDTTDGSVVDVRFSKLPKEVPSSNFDPREYRKPKSPIKLWMAYLNLLRTGFGAGLLAIPLALSQVGLILGSLLVLAVGVLIIHTHLTLLWCLNEISRQLQIPYISYRYGFRMALLRGPAFLHCLGNIGPCLIAAIMICSQLGICSVFVIFTADSLRDMMDWPSSRSAIYVLLLPYIILEISMRNLKIISFVSMAGNIMNIVGASLTLYLIIKGPQNGVPLFTHSSTQVLFATGIMLFNLSAVGVVLALDKNLQQPWKLTENNGVIVVSMCCITVFSIIFGCLGAWSFGTMEENILRSLPFDDNISMVVMALYMIAVAFAYPIQCYPAIQIMLEVIKNYDTESVPSETTMKVVEYIFRPLFVVLTFNISYFLPFQGPLVAFVGSLCTSLIAIVFPALMQACLLYPDEYGEHRFTIYKNIFIIITGCLWFFFGIIFCGYLIYIRLMFLNSSQYEYYS